MSSSSLLQTKGGGSGSGSSKGLESPNVQTNTQYVLNRPVSISGSYHRAPFHSIQQQQQQQSISQSSHSLNEFGDVKNNEASNEKREENIWAERMHTVMLQLVVDLGTG